MALIKCNHCGKMVSDRAGKCPHCGSDPREESGQPQANPAEEPAKVEENAPSSGANKVLIAVVAVLAVIAIGFAGYLCLGKGESKTEPMPMDTLEADTSVVDDFLEADTTVVEEEAQEEAVAADSASCDFSDESSEAPQPAEEEGFHSDGDVMEFVTGNSYYHDGVTLRITEDAVFANENKISQSRPVFRRISKETGKITARPSISITVKRSDNKLVDNKSGDAYNCECDVNA